ncbi:hypothetical protein D770_16615 [Flammeovirgaceae bacterium 311]|nr:hypothetical protein D770_16615 [Flammeovirgaceae bacterium 311]
MENGAFLKESSPSIYIVFRTFAGMRLLSLLLLLQVMLLSSAPALAHLPLLSCCAENCEEQKNNSADEEEHDGEAAEQCNPFACAGCCLLIQAAPQLTPGANPVAPHHQQLCILIENPSVQPQYGIWHPPRWN